MCFRFRFRFRLFICFICFGWTIKKKIKCDFRKNLAPLCQSNSVHIHISKYKDMTCDDCVRDRQVCILGTFRPQNAMRSCYVNHYVVFVSSRWKSSDFICWPENWTSRAAPVIGKFLAWRKTSKGTVRLGLAIKSFEPLTLIKMYGYFRRKDDFSFDYSQPAFRTNKSIF